MVASASVCRQFSVNSENRTSVPPEEPTELEKKLQAEVESLTEQNAKLIEKTDDLLVSWLECVRAQINALHDFNEIDTLTHRTNTSDHWPMEKTYDTASPNKYKMQKCSVFNRFAKIYSKWSIRWDMPPLPCRKRRCDKISIWKICTTVWCWRKTRWIKSSSDMASNKSIQSMRNSIQIYTKHFSKRWISYDLCALLVHWNEVKQFANRFSLQECSDVEPGTVVEVTKTGYKLHERCIRPALVGVSRK